jgi:dipeptidyl aminopeptidase/acylaminoacyl peptidase
VDAGTAVTIFVSAGAPLLAFDDDEDILVVDSGTGRRRDPIARGTAIEKDPAWSFDGSSVVFTSGDEGGGQVMLANRERPDATPIALTPEGRRYSDLAWAPTLDRNVVAMARRADPTIDLCFGLIRQRQAMRISCKEEPDFIIGRKISWAPDGKSVFAFGATNDQTEFGILQWTTEKAFSPRESDWSEGEFITDTSRQGRGVIDAALSPDGERLAVVSGSATGGFQLFFAKPDDFKLTDADRPGVRACKVIWRPDGRELVVVQSDDCGADTGELVRLPADSPRDQRSLKLGGDNPTFQPIIPG